MYSQYQSLLKESANWEDFVIEGVGILGCCGIDPDTYASQSACIEACKTKCPAAVSKKPGGCKGTVPVTYRNCCYQCCGYHHAKNTINSKICKGNLAGTNMMCGPTTYYRPYCRAGKWVPGTTTTGGGWKIVRLGQNCTP